jgi:hypothetical protein
MALAGAKVWWCGLPPRPADWSDSGFDIGGPTLSVRGFRDRCAGGEGEYGIRPFRPRSEEGP